MRSMDPTSSDASSCAVNDAAIQARTVVVAGPAIACTRVTHSASSPAAGSSGAENRHASRMPAASKQAVRDAALERLLLDREQLRGVVALDAALDGRPQCAVDGLNAVGEVAGGAASGGCRVVELVRETGRHRPQRGEPLAGGGARLQEAHDRTDHVHHVPVHGRLRARERRRTARGATIARHWALHDRGDPTGPGRRPIVTADTAHTEPR